MKKRHNIPARYSYTILKQVCNLIPGGMVDDLAEEYGVDEQSRTFTPWSHTVSLMHAQLTHAIGLNDVCDSLQMNGGTLSTIRGARPPTRNNLSHANKIRDCDMAEALYWQMMDCLMKQSPGFGKGKIRRGYLRRFRNAIHAIDSTTIQLVANCMDWAKHRRRKAAAKCHLRLNLQSFLPACAIIDTAKFHDSSMAKVVCAGLKDGEIAIFDKAYLDFGHLYDLTERGVWWVSRGKDNMKYRVVKRLTTTDNPRILEDEIIELTVFYSRKAYPLQLRRVVAMVEVDGEDKEMVFLSNHLHWSAWTVAELYRCRWDIEVFFKEIKQTLQLCDFLGHNKNAVLWQVWTALILYVLLRFLAFANSWRHGFKRLFCLLRSSVWDCVWIGSLASLCGTAGGAPAMRAAPELLYLPGFGPQRTRA